MGAIASHHCALLEDVDRDRARAHSTIANGALPIALTSSRTTLGQR
jgi:hypothetical protein